jgi:hypothetical protein
MNIKRYTVKEDWKDYSVTLEVDLDVLTEDRATLINEFWSSSEDRLAECDGNVQHATIRLFGQAMICIMLEQGGAMFGPATPASWSDFAGSAWSRDVWMSEGWGGYGPQGEENADYGWCGIRCIGADVSVPSFDELELAEVPNG